MKTITMEIKDAITRCLMAFVIVFGIGLHKAEAQLVITPGNEIQGWTADSLVRNVLMSGGVSISNVRFNGYDDDLVCDNIGIFETGITPTNLGIESGLVIATGNVRVAEGPNDLTEKNDSTTCSGYYDSSLARLATDSIYDVAVLEFDFVPWDSIISFSYVFGSEEYPEYVDGPYNDVFGFFVSGLNPDGGAYANTNMALIPGTTEVVSINTVNDHHNQQYYVDNAGGSTIQFDGFTVVMTVSFKVVPMTQYHIKMGICDVGDFFADSGVFLEANSFQSPMSYAMLLDGMHYMEIPDGYQFCTNRLIDFETETTWNYDNVKWYFGDGTSAQGLHVQHAYTRDGFYEVMNVLYNPYRAMDSVYLSKVIEVRSKYGSEEGFTCYDVPYLWHGMQLSEPGIYTDTLESYMGCDSIVTLNLSVGDFFLTDTVAESCDLFKWYGQTYNTSGQYEHTLLSTMGCDSIIRLHLTVNHVVETDTVATSCGTFTWYGQTYQTSGQYEHILRTVMGCDSIIRLHLNIDPVMESDTTAISCGGFTWHGRTYDSSGDYEQLFQTALGCDSLVILHLTVNQESLQRALQGPTQVAAASNMIYANYEYFVSDSLSLPPNTLNWSCTHPDWIVSPSENRYRCHLWVTNIGQGTLIARTEHDCDTVYSIDINATWFDVDEDNGIPLKLFPNPAQTEVTVQAEEILRIRIIDAIGQVALEKIFDQTDAACIDISIIPQGVYLVEISTKKGKTMRKLVVSR
ncbi:MAG: choice-of-anchor L domain-containing protein [Bacteroidales bacterium]|nr:choice-of-anchor L domain-containing protein [Bacteroidales bacterium]